MDDASARTPPLERPPLRLWLVEDEWSFREALEGLVAVAAGLEVSGSFGHYGGAEAALAAGVEAPDLVVMDLRLTPGPGGEAATRSFRAAVPGVPVLVLTNVDDAEAVFGALRAGATGYVLKDRVVEDFAGAVWQAASGGMTFSPGVAGHVREYFAGPGPSPLSAREEEVVRLLAEGMSQRRIAERLFISPHTVDSHVRNVYAKLHVSSGIEAVVEAVRLGIVRPGLPAGERAPPGG